MQDQFLFIASLAAVHSPPNHRRQPELSRSLPAQGTGIAQISRLRKIPQDFSVSHQHRVGHRKGNQLPVEQRQLQRKSLPCQRLFRVTLERQDPHILIIIHPHGCRHCHISIRLGDPQKVVGVSIRQRQGHFPRRRIQLAGRENTAACADDLHGADRAVGGILQHRPNLQSLRRAQNGTHDLAVQPIIDIQIRILCRVDPAGPHRLIQRFLCQRFRQHRRAAAARGAPVGAVVVLPHRGRHMPARVQRQEIIGIEGRAVLSLHLKQLHDPVTGGVVILKAVEFSVHQAGMIELAHRPRNLRQGGAVTRQCAHPGLPGRLPAGGVEGVDMPQHFVLAPAHLIAEDPHEVLPGYRRGSLFPRCPFGADGGAVPGDAAVCRVVKGVAVIRHGKKVQPFHRRCGGKSLLHTSQAVRESGVGIQKAVIYVPFPVRPAGGDDGIGIERLPQKDAVNVRRPLGDLVGAHRDAAPVPHQHAVFQDAAPDHDPQALRKVGEGAKLRCGQRSGSLRQQRFHQEFFLPRLSGDQYNVSRLKRLGNGQENAAGVVLHKNRLRFRPDHRSPECDSHGSLREPFHPVNGDHGRRLRFQQLRHLRFLKQKQPLLFSRHLLSPYRGAKKCRTQ